MFIAVYALLLCLHPAIGQHENGEYFASPFEQHRNMKIYPFKALFLFHDGVEEKYKQIFQVAADFVNAKLGTVLTGPMLTEIRFRRTKDCSKPNCLNVTVPDEYSLPCTDSDGKISVPEQDVPEIPTTNVKDLNTANYSLVALIAIHGQGAHDFSCEYFEQQNKYRPPCRFFGPPVIGEACQTGDFDRPTHVRLTFCKRPDEFAVEQGELNMVLLHEILHFVIGTMDFPGHHKLSSRSWHTETGQSISETFALVTSPNVQKAARAYFQCKSLEGVEVPVRKYPNGTLDPKWGHWTFRLFPDDILAPHTSFQEKLSPLTLAAILDRGWFEVDTSKAEDLPSWHPSMDGCDLATSSCYDLIKKAREKSDSLHQIWPICAQQDPISTRCSPDGRRRMLCHQIEGYSCHSLHSPACIDHHPICEHATQQSHFFPNIDFAPDSDSDTICLTFTSFPGLTAANISTEYYLPPCVPRECNKDKSAIVLRFNSKIPCEFACTRDKFPDSILLILQTIESSFVADMANRRVEYVPSRECRSAVTRADSDSSQKIQLICPDYNIICENGTGTTRDSNGGNKRSSHMIAVLICLLTLRFL